MYSKYLANCSESIFCFNFQRNEYMTENIEIKFCVVVRYLSTCCMPWRVQLDWQVWQYRLWNFKSGDTKLELKINIPKGNYWIFGIGVVGRCQNCFMIDKNQFSSRFFVIGIFGYVTSIFKSLYFYMAMNLQKIANYIFL